jgi:hypothetical protein
MFEDTSNIFVQKKLDREIYQTTLSDAYRHEGGSISRTSATMNVWRWFETEESLQSSFSGYG